MAVGRTDSMHELIIMMESMFTDTIIGSDINLVKHLFYFLKANETEFDLFHEEKLYKVLVEEIKNNTVYLYIEDFQPGAMRGRIVFEVNNQVFTFEIVFTESIKSRVIFRIPTELQSVHHRANKRINCDDLFMNFIILYRGIEGGSRRVGNYYFSESRFRHLIQEIKKDDLNLELINLMMVDYIRTVSRDFEILLFKDKSSDVLRDILKKEKKTIFIENCNDMNHYVEDTRYPELLTNYREYYMQLLAENDPIHAMDFLAELQQSERRNFFVSYLYSPIILYDDTIGYIKVFTTAMDQYQISENQALFIHELSEIISYAYTKVSIKEKKYDKMNVTTKIVDISLTGLLFEIDDEKMYNYLKKHNRLKMLIPIGNHKLNINGHIVRFIESGSKDVKPFVEEGKFLLGVNYFSINPDDIMVLENYIYQKSGMILSE